MKASALPPDAAAAGSGSGRRVSSRLPLIRIKDMQGNRTYAIASRGRLSGSAEFL
jgi:hypothetical protein